MKPFDHRAGVFEDNLVTRNIKLECQSSENIQEAVKDIDELLGLDNVHFDEKSHVLSLSYDATHLNLDKIEEVLSQYKVDISHDWWSSFKEGYYRFVDNNVKENAQHQPWSCHTRPAGKKPKK